MRKSTYQPDATDRRIINALQEGFPLCPRPYAEAAARLELAETELIERLKRLRDFRTGIDGGGHRLEAVGRYGHGAQAERAHRLNMWFVLATETPAEIETAARAIENETGLTVLRFPKEQEFFIGFRVVA